MSCLYSLTDDLLKLVMQHVPPKDRLTSCCLVGSRLHAAAIAATQELDLWNWHSPFRNIQESGFLAWLPHHGQHLTSLHLGRCEPLLQLPCPELLELKLWACSVQLWPTADGQPGVVQGCTKLTHLELLSIEVIDGPAGAVVDCLSSLVYLQHLSSYPWRYPSYKSLKALSEATLPRLVHLTHLYIEELSLENLAQLGSLTNLQELCLADAPTGQVYDDDGMIILLGPGIVPGLSFPASLTKLVLIDGVDGSILSLAPTGLKHLKVQGPVSGPDEGPGSLLSYIAELQQLLQLDILLGKGDWPSAGPAYSALTASSSLVSLSLYHTTLPAGVWPYVFPAARQLLALTFLWFFSSGWEHEHVPELDVQDLPSTWGAADLPCLFSCCPNLRRIYGMSLQHGLHVSELQKLTGLTSLYIFYAVGGVADREHSMEGLAAVTQLQYLNINLDRHDVEVSSLLPLTSLTALATLECCLKKDPEDVEDDALYLHADDGPVWLQLLEECAAEPDCQPAALCSLAQQLAEQRALTAQQQQHLAEYKQANMQQQEQLSAQQELVAAQQQQLTAQQRVAAEQGARIAGLEGQLQQLLQRLPPQ